MEQWNEVISQIIYAKLEIVLDKYKIVGAYGPQTEEAREEKEIFWCEI